MYKLLKIAIVASLLFSSLANAEGPTQKEHCETVSQMANAAMGMRQYNAPIKAALDISQEFANTGTVSGIKTTAFMDSVIIDAYSQDLRYSESMKEISINEFATKYYLSCMQ